MITGKKGTKKITRVRQPNHDWALVDGEIVNMHAPFCWWCGHSLMTDVSGTWSCLQCGATYVEIGEDS